MPNKNKSAKKTAIRKTPAKAVKKISASSSKKTVKKPSVTAVARVGKIKKIKPVSSKAAGSKKKTAPVGKSEKKLGSGDFRKYHELLLRLRTHVSGQIDFLSADNLNRSQNDNELDFKSEEQGTDNFDRDLALSRVSMEQNAVFEIDEALHRIQKGTYGACECCGGHIEKARLAVMPHCRMCVLCKSAAESGSKRVRSSEQPVFREVSDVSSEMESEEAE